MDSYQSVELLHYLFLLVILPNKQPNFSKVIAASLLQNILYFYY
jgi:hypothetical protein